MGLCRNCRPLFQIIFTDFWTEKVEMSGKKNKKVAKKIFLLTLAHGKLPEKKKQNKTKGIFQIQKQLLTGILISYSRGKLVKILRKTPMVQYHVRKVAGIHYTVSTPP